ncbi:alpha/beta fold hydrolase [Duganella sp. PWIR1]
MYSDISYLSDDGLRLYARDYHAHGGAACLPVICIHGLTRNSADFEDIAPIIAAQGRRVIAVDVRGRGNSDYDPQPQRYMLPVYANDVAQLARKLGIARAVFIGTSMGGLITMTLAMRRPDLVAAAVLNDVGPTLSPRGLQRIAGYAGRGGAVADWDQATAYIRDINAYAFPANSDEEWRRWAQRAFAEAADGKLQLRYDPNIAIPVRTNKIRSHSMLAQFAFRNLAWRRPTMLIRGALSDLVEPAQAGAMRAAAPRMRYAEVPNVGHAPMLDEPEAQEALRSFLAGVD